MTRNELTPSASTGSKIGPTAPLRSRLGNDAPGPSQYLPSRDRKGAVRRAAGVFIPIHGPLACAALAIFIATQAAAAPLILQKGDRIVFIGNTFAERLALFSYFESLVMLQYPNHELTFRNLGWSGDTLTLQPRPLNFGDMDTHLTAQKPDAIIAFFGMDESFAGQAGLAKFEQDWRDFLKKMRAAKFNGKSAPRIAIVSPIAHEKIGDYLPDPAKHNENLALYTEAMRKIAAENGMPFADLFTPTRSLSKLTINGLHLTQHGDWIVAQLLARELGLLPKARQPLVLDASKLPLRFELDTQTLLPPPTTTTEPPSVDYRPMLTVRGLAPGRYVLRANGQDVVSAEAAEWARGVTIRQGPPVAECEKLRLAVVDKNQQFFYRWRPVNGEYVYGRRKEPFGIVNFPAEMKTLDGMIADLDGKIQGMSKAVREQVYELVRTGN